MKIANTNAYSKITLGKPIYAEVHDILYSDVKNPVWRKVLYDVGYNHTHIINVVIHDAIINNVIRFI
jgi:hypothetical protein